MAGKTTLLKHIVRLLFEAGDRLPLVLQGSSLEALSTRKVPKLLRRAFPAQYDSAMAEQYEQLPPDRRILIIDDWHRSGLNADGRRVFLEEAGKYCSATLLFVDDMFSLQELAEHSAADFLTFTHALIQEFNSELRGRLVEKWVSLGQEYTASPQDLAREVEDAEALIKSMLRDNVLPSRPFIILSLLQAAQEGRSALTEAGSFGYLYDVLVTTALSATRTATPQLEKKYVLLALVAYEMFKNNVTSLSESRVRGIAATYAREHLIRIDIDNILSDLTAVRALHNVGGNYSFAYTHLFYFFIARYYKDHLARSDDAALRQEIEHMVDNIGSDKYSTILLFIVYFARNTTFTSIIRRLVTNANRIFASLSPADLVGGISFISELPSASAKDVPDENADLAEGRIKRRQAEDRLASKQSATTTDGTGAYSDDLPESTKFNIGAKHIDLLGQVLRNFPASLLGPEKVEILQSCYLLGLRMITNAFRLLTELEGVVRQASSRCHPSKWMNNVGRITRPYWVLANILVLWGRFITLGMISRISTSVGLPDLEDAYEATVQAMGETDATRLINVAIRLDHFKGFPETQVRELHRTFKGRNPFADRLLLDLVLQNMIVFGVQRLVRERMMSQFNIKPNIAGMIEAGASKTK